MALPATSWSSRVSARSTRSPATTRPTAAPRIAASKSWSVKEIQRGFRDPVVVVPAGFRGRFGRCLADRRRAGQVGRTTLNYVNWWLFGLSFATGFVLTSALTVRPVKRRARRAPSAQPDPPTTKILADPPTTKIPLDPPTTKIPVANESVTTKISVGQEFPTTKVQVATELATTKIPVSPLAPYGPGSAN